ncbi:YdiU family protein [Neopusillimonas maritima]|jgi:uncharacterized protein YdiU (UPF0061 family)|uniref:Protein nucleotidyltransferase YdiU n=1 Tax=Neopusillimonas maritima TaxID=2026239 RepID=A0ABX9MXJ6_9BURK|nr:YdiU family protein [Neopusillimonas maritima]RII83695.1 hypothetical protein CJO09_00095 [Neopusillimonas maritima]
MSINPFGHLHIENSFADDLPARFYTRLETQPLTNPRLLHVNKDVAHALGLREPDLESPTFLEVVSGSEPLPGGQTLAAVYSGHQFGVWAGQLGDGRAHLLGEISTDAGPQELQLKGSGLTPYSRMGDGRAVVRSSVREYLAGEAMAGLGIPTTRALSLVVADDPVYRETQEAAAVVTRVAPSFVRFGTFEHWAQDPDSLKLLLRYVVPRFYPQCLAAQESAQSDLSRDTILRFLKEVVVKSARLVADWQTCGFCHGVMNTDNMSILGITLDYGPYGFMDGFRINHVCNHTDTHGRYAWNVQPAVMHWNLYRLASSLTALGLESDELKTQLQVFEGAFLQAYQGNLVRKFGWLSWHEQDQDLVDEWWRLLHTQSADFTLSFRRLATALDQPESFFALFDEPAPAREWLEQYRQRVQFDGRSEADRVTQMLSANPLYVLRNHLAQQAIDAAEKDDASVIDALMTVLRDPYTERAGFEAYAQAAPEWARHLEVSCSS